MLAALRNYLIEQGYRDIYIDYWPESPVDVITIYCWEKIAASIYDGTADHLIQLRVRRRDYDEAMRVLKKLVALLDSGDNERPIPLDHAGVVIGRVRRLPILLERQENAVTVYAELSLWGME